MSDIRPFKGLRPRADLVQKVASPPYDVLNSAEAREMAQSNPHSFLRVVKAEIDLPEDADVHGDAVYAKSAENFQQMIEGGVLVRDGGPARRGERSRRLTVQRAEASAITHGNCSELQTRELWPFRREEATNPITPVGTS